MANGKILKRIILGNDRRGPTGESGPLPRPRWTVRKTQTGDGGGGGAEAMERGEPGESCWHLLAA